MKFGHVKAGDTVLRMIGGRIPMELLVTDVTDDLILCSTPSGSVGGWTFDRATGVEVDELLKWGPKYGVTGSTLVEKR